MLERPLRRMLGNAAAAVDTAVNLTALARSAGHRRASELRHEERLALLGRLRERYKALGASENFFREPRRIDPAQSIRHRTEDGLLVTDLTWPSDYTTFLPEVADQYALDRRNATAAARLVTHSSEPRPIAVLIHGYLGGDHHIERRIWPLEFLRRMGMDAALFVLPFHGSRSAPRRLGQYPPFPGADPRVTNEGFRQTMADFRDFVGFLRERGHPKIGVMGMSLGGFSTSLAATLEPALAFAVPIIPLTSIADVARARGLIGKTPHEVAAQYRALDSVHRVTSPLHRELVIPSENVLVVAGERDQITPISHARKLAAHFRCRLETWPGGHLVQFGRAEKFRSIGRFFNEIGIVSRG